MACAKLFFEDKWKDLSVIPVKELGEKEKTESVEMGSVSKMVADDILWNVTISQYPSDFLVKLLSF